jgi:hypothetical protein
LKRDNHAMQDQPFQTRAQHVCVDCAARCRVAVDRVYSAQRLKAAASDVRDYMGDHVALFEATVAATSIEESSRSAGSGGDPSNNDLARSGAAYVYR